MIEVRNLTKRYGHTLAVDRLSFEVEPGHVTGFLGPNGAGKSTTMRMIVGLDTPTSGSATVDGRPFCDAPAPMQSVGALLDAKAVHPGRSARSHLAWMARAGGIPPSRVDEVLGDVGLSDVAGKRVGGFSLGMSQRLGIAGALLGEPRTLLFDEPVNGLDPEGIMWVRKLFQRLAGEGRTILVSSHAMSEMEKTADRVLVIGRGRLIADTSIKEFTTRAGGSVRVVTPAAEKLTPLLVDAGATVTPAPDGSLVVTGIEAGRIGDIAAPAAIPLHELTPNRASLEEAFMELTHDSVDYRAAA